MSGTNPAKETYSVAFKTDVKKLSAIRLETFADDAYPAKGPGRAPNGNFVLNEFRITTLPTGASTPAKPVKLVNPAATFGQDTYPIANAIDGNLATGWAIAPQFGVNQSAVFGLQAPIDAKAGVTLAIALEHRFGTGHNIGKFRISFTTDKAPKLGSPVPADLLKVLEVEAAKRTPEQKARVLQAYLATDLEYARLQRDVPVTPPGDARVLGAQDLTWALINTPSFLFNR